MTSNDLKEDMKVNLPFYAMTAAGTLMLYSSLLGKEPGEVVWELGLAGMIIMSLGYMFRIMTKLCRIESKLDEMMGVKDDDL